MTEVQLDQHFLKDESIIKEEVELAEIDSKDRVIEIGAGKGVLTKELAKKTKNLRVFEIDKRFKEELKDIQEVIFGNCFDYSLEGYNKIVANIPYSLSETILQKAIKENIQSLVLIVSEGFKEVLESDSKLGIVANLFFDIKVIKKVDRQLFFPVPKVDSYLIKFIRKKNSKEDEPIIYILSKDGKIKNALISWFVVNGKTKRQAKEMLKTMKIDKKILDKPVARITSKFIKLIKERL